MAILTILTTATLMALLIPRGLPVMVDEYILRSPPIPASPPLITSLFLDFIQSVAQSHLIPGLAVAVVHVDGDTEYATWGLGTEEGDPMTIETMVVLASCSKAFLSAGIGILMNDFETGRNMTSLPQNLTRFDWDTKIKDLLPEKWELMDEWAREKASVRDVLSHVSGMPRHDASYDRIDTPSSVVSRMRYLRPAYELRERWLYNNQMYMLCSHIISKYATQTYAQFVEERLFSPLNMSSTYSVAKALDSGKLTHVWTPQSRRIPVPLSEDTVALKAGPGGVIASVKDLAKWMRMLLHAGVDPSTNATIIPPSAFEEITTAHTIVSGKGENSSPSTSITGYGMGWFRNSYLGREIVWHDGSLPGISTSVLFAPSDGVGLAVLINAGKQGEAINSIIFDILSRALNHRFSDAVTIPALAFELSESPAIQNTTNSGVPAPSPDLAYDFSGKYHNTGYGIIMLCNASSISSYCRNVLSTFRAVDGGAHNTTHELFAVWPRVTTTHLRLTSIARSESQHRYIATLTSLFPWGYGWDRRPFEAPEELGSVDFVVDEATREVVGFGLVTTTGEWSMRERRGHTVDERADAWFARTT